MMLYHSDNDNPHGANMPKKHPNAPRSQKKFLDIDIFVTLP